MVGRHGEPDAGLDVGAHAVRGERLVERVVHALAGPSGGAEVGARAEQDGELVAPEAGDEGARAELPLEPAGQLDEHLTARVVAEAVVELLEASRSMSSRPADLPLARASAMCRSARA